MSRILAVQSWCYRHWDDNTQVIARMKACGIKAVELCARHVDFDDPSEFESIVQAYRDSQVQIVSLGVERLGPDEKQQRHRFDFARLAGATRMSVDFSLETLAEALPLADSLAEEYGIKLGIHNHGGRHVLGCPDVLAWVFSQCSDRIGLTLDTAWALDSGVAPMAFARRFADRLHLVHLKDFVFDQARRHTDVVIGTGNLDLSEVARTLDELHYSGPVVLEYEADVENPVPALCDCARAWQAVG